MFTRPFRFSFILGLALFFMVQPGLAQISPADPDSILVGSQPRPSVLLVGTFHFGYYNLDAHKVEEDDQVDILSTSRQKELGDLLEYIARFNPTKIAIEAGQNTGYLMHRYRDYRQQKNTLSRDEIEQIGFRLMERFNLDTLYGVNSSHILGDLYDGPDSLVLRPWLDSIYTDWDFESNDIYSEKYRILYRYKDHLTSRLPLLDYFQYLNSDKMLHRGFGSYLVGDFTLGDTRGADALTLHWYNRNLRIFRKIQRIATSTEDRILVLFGAGHVQILKHLFECSPEFNLIKFGDL